MQSRPNHVGTRASHPAHQTLPSSPGTGGKALRCSSGARHFCAAASMPLGTAAISILPVGPMSARAGAGRVETARGRAAITATGALACFGGAASAGLGTGAVSPAVTSINSDVAAAARPAAGLLTGSTAGRGLACSVPAASSPAFAWYPLTVAPDLIRGLAFFLGFGTGSATTVDSAAASLGFTARRAFQSSITARSSGCAFPVRILSHAAETASARAARRFASRTLRIPPHDRTKGTGRLGPPALRSKPQRVSPLTPPPPPLRIHATSRSRP